MHSLNKLASSNVVHSIRLIWKYCLSNVWFWKKTRHSWLRVLYDRVRIYWVGWIRNLNELIHRDWIDLQSVNTGIDYTNKDVVSYFLFFLFSLFYLHRTLTSTFSIGAEWHITLHLFFLVVSFTVFLPYLAFFPRLSFLSLYLPFIFQFFFKSCLSLIIGFLVFLQHRPTY